MTENEAKSFLREKLTKHFSKGDIRLIDPIISEMMRGFDPGTQPLDQFRQFKSKIDKVWTRLQKFSEQDLVPAKVNEIMDAFKKLQPSFMGKKKD